MEKQENFNFDDIHQRILQLGYRPVTAEDCSIFTPYYEKMNGSWLSVLSFISILSWADILATYYKTAGGLVCGLQYDCVSNTLLTGAFIGHYSRKNFDEAFSVVRSDVKTLGFPLRVEGVSEWMLPFYQEVSGISWEIDKPRELMDYIYAREDFVQYMESSDFRYRYRYFVRHFSPETVVLAPEHSEECMNFMREVWCSSRQCSECFACPLKAVSRCVGAIDILQVKGILVRVSGRIAGLCIVSREKGVGLYEFRHAYNHMKGISEYLLRECFTRFLSGTEEINFTEDMGEEGLRAYKSKLAPYTLLPRYTLKELC